MTSRSSLPLSEPQCPHPVKRVVKNSPDLTVAQRKYAIHVGHYFSAPKDVMVHLRADSNSGCWESCNRHAFYLGAVYLCISTLICSVSNLSFMTGHLQAGELRPRGEVTYQVTHSWEAAELGFGQGSSDLRPEILLGGRLDAKLSPNAGAGGFS